MKQCYSEVLERQAAVHCQITFWLTFLYALCGVRRTKAQMLRCTLPLNIGQGILLRLFSALQPALQICHLPVQNLPFAAGLHQPPLKLHATYRSEYQVTYFVWRIADQGQTSSLLSVRIPVHTAAVQYWR